MTNERVPPRIYCIPATQAPIVAVFKRGPSAWSQIGLWDLSERRYEPGAWLHGRIFPRRSDLSPNGRFLCYFAHKPGATWEKGGAYVAISKLPWLSALHAFATCGTWTRGYFFTEGRGRRAPEGTDLPLPYGLSPTPVVQFAAERRRGWVEAPDCPKRDPQDMWDVRRNARLQKRQPGGSRLLCVESLGCPGGEFGTEQAIDGLRVNYWMETDGGIELLSHVQWADWDREGHLLVATRSGQLQIWDFAVADPEVVFEEDLSTAEPSPAAPPSWAQRW